MDDDAYNEPLYMISVAAKLAGVHPQTLRSYEQKGLVSPQRTSGNTRMYSKADIDRLALINEITGEGSQVLWEYARDKIITPHHEKGNITD